jgi:gas vesicle protein
MTKKHPERKFILGAMLGSAIGAVSAMMFTTKKGQAIKKNAMQKLHQFENYVVNSVNKKKTHVKRLVSHGKKQVMKHIAKKAKKR